MKKLLLYFLVLSSIGASAQYWTEKASGFTNINSTLPSISIVDANVIWAVSTVGTGNSFTKSVDGGNTWTSGFITLGGATALNVSNISAFSATTAWVSASVSPSTPLQGIWKTVDGGANWTRQATALFNTTPDSYVDFVHFWVDGQTGICVGDAKTGDTVFEIYETADGGTTWVGGPNINIPVKLTGEYPIANSYDYSGNTIWFGTTKGRLFRSINNGSDWTVSQTPEPAGLQRFSFSDANKGILITSTGLLYKTIDGGDNWTLISTTGYNLGTISYVPNTPYVFSTGSSAIPGSSYSTNDGDTWTTIDGVYHNKAFFMNINVGFSGGKNTSPTVGGIFKHSTAPLFVDKFEAKKQISVYPNPTNGLLHLDSETTLIKKATVFDLLGRQVYSSKFSALNKVDLDLKSLQSGTYVLKVTYDSGKMETMKVIKN
jgi:photosystem II stability/assembly factor-like uncharacterized protein